LTSITLVYAIKMLWTNMTEIHVL